MRRLLIVALALLPLAAQAYVNIAEAPIGRLSLPWWRLRWEQTLAQGKASPDARVIWLGDSITQYWQREGALGYDNILPVWKKYYGPYHALDFGFVGDTTASLIWRLDHGQVAGLHPALTIILIGANNFGRVHWGATMTVPAVEAVAANVHARLPDTHILLLGVLPSIRSPWVDAQTVAANAALANYYSGNAFVTFEDVGGVLEKNGRTDASLFMDPRYVPPQPALHPDAEGMTKIAAAIEPIVRKYAD